MRPVGIWLAASLVLLSAPVQFQVRGAALTDDNSLSLPRPGDFQLRIVSPNVLEVLMVTAKDTDPAPLTVWNFINANGNGALPPVSAFDVSANGQSVSVSGVGFKRRVLYAPLRTRDLRVANWLYLQLAAPLPSDAVVEVKNPSATLWGNSVNFTATNNSLRYSPAIHVNQAGYMANYPKKAMVGYYLGTLGEMPISTNAGFQLVNISSGAVAFSGTLTRRPDIGYTYSPTPYQQVYEADFSAFNAVGEFKLVVPGLGASFPIHVDDTLAGTYARTYALGIYHQRCGTDNSLPFTRYTHKPCHTNLVLIPAWPGPEQDFVNFILNHESSGATSNPRHTAPRMSNVGASLYPFVNVGWIDTTGGHHDAGDYSKYTTSVAALLHYLTFAVDALPGVKDLDNLSLPESGDGISDILQEAKWEADYLAKLQDADGGFYFIVYPRARQYELDVLPDSGDLQLVLPKNTAATAAAVAALAEIASSPSFKAAYPAAAANYLAAAERGWAFLQNAIATHGRDGSYQMITFSGDVFMHDDEIAWAAAALYVATGDPIYDAALRSQVPNPNEQDLRRWSWWSMFGGYGCAFRTYAFAARSGRLSPGQLDATYLSRCENEIRRAATNVIRWSGQNAYGTSFVEESKSSRLAGWYFSGEWTFDPAVAYALEPRAQYLDVILKNYNYEMGCNPANVTFLTGLGWKRQREIVHQYALNDKYVLPPNGIPLGNIQASYDYLQLYKSELSALSFPSDSAPSGTYPYYDRWADTFNVSTEFVVSQTAKTLPAAAMLMAMTPLKTDPSESLMGQIVGFPETVPVDGVVTGTVVAAGYDLSKARVTWEASDQQPFIGAQFRLTPGNIGTNWIEAEALFPDGQRIIARTNFFALPVTDLPRVTVEPEIVALYHLKSDFKDATGNNPDFAPQGGAALDPVALYVHGIDDRVQVSIPNSALRTPGKTKAISVEARLFINAYKGHTVSSATLLSLVRSWDYQMSVQKDKWKSFPDVLANGSIILESSVLTNSLTPRKWHLLSLTLDENNYVVHVDGVEVGRKPSGDLANWGGAGSATLQLGDFDGWIGEVVVWNRTNASIVTPPPATNPPPSTNPPPVINPPGSTNPPAAYALPASDDGHFHFSARTTTGLAFVLKASTDLQTWKPIFTNYFGGIMDYIDTRSKDLPQRYYRVEPLGTLQPRGVVQPRAPDGNFRLRLDGVSGVPFVVQASTNLVDWEDVFVNSSGGPLDFVDADSKKFPRRFYRAALRSMNPVIMAVPSPSPDRFRLHMSGRNTEPFVVQTSPDMVNWYDLYTSLYGMPVDLGLGDTYGTPTTYYRTQPLNMTPALTAETDITTGAVSLQAGSPNGVPFAIEFTTDFTNWTGLATNSYGGWYYYYDWEAATGPTRAYRAVTLPILPEVTILPSYGDGIFRVQTETRASQPFTLQASVDLNQWSNLYTNDYGGYLYFTDVESPNLPQRFYRVRVLPAQLDLAWPPTETLTQIHLDGLPGAPYLIQTSTDQSTWTTIATNSVGGPIELLDSRDASSPTRYYRVVYQTEGVRGDR